ncbi:MAG: efflux RND transporter permease subunit [Planctomycetota bacterium]|jgi:multidrug efflux pump subunit AcrB|nr:efflux RND transporter permease subunit [Planctomycetota bacterium]
MNLATTSFRNPVLIWTLTALTLLGGYFSFNGLGKLEDPPFTIKTALVYTAYPGATAAEVEEEVTEPLEMAIQQMDTIWRLRSLSKKGLSVITVDFKKTTPAPDMQQTFDELRRKVGDTRKNLPPGAGASLVNDDFGDVYGVNLALHGNDYTMRELYQVAKDLQRELVLVHDVAKVQIIGAHPEVIGVTYDPARLAELDISPQHIAQVIQDENLVADAGSVMVGPERLILRPTTVVESVEDLGQLLIQSDSGNQIRLRDLAVIERDYAEAPASITRTNGDRCIVIGVAGLESGNVSNMGRALTKRLDQYVEQEGRLPLGMSLTPITFQPNDIDFAINGFLLNLLAAIVIVILVLMVFMGLRSALIIGFVLLVTILGTFIFMAPWGIALQRISLGALIIALGMLVDNAIVVIDGVRTGMSRGQSPEQAATSIVGQTQIPLLGATVIAILAFAAIGTSPDSTGEICRSLFQVVLISLSLSWVFAVTLTPLLGARFLKPPAADAKDPYDNAFYRNYRKLLLFAIRMRALTIAAVVAMFLLSAYGFGFARVSFFPEATRTQFSVEMWLPQGLDIEETDRRLEEIREFVVANERVEGAHTFVGQGAPRFMLTYTPEKPYACYGMFMVDVLPESVPQIGELIGELEQAITSEFTDVVAFGRLFQMGPSEGGKIQARIIGPDANVLRELETEAIAILRADPQLKGVRSDWMNRVKSLRPVLSPERATLAGVTHQDVARAMQGGFLGRQIGVYREGDDLWPIEMRAPEAWRREPGRIMDLPIMSPTAGQMVPMGQVVDHIETVVEDDLIGRYDRERCITIHADPDATEASVPFARIRPEIEGMALPAGYRVEWGGEYEGQQDAIKYLTALLPVMLALMVVIVIALFNSIRKPLVIWATVPLALIGITSGLLITGAPFGFVALLGALALTGMLIKNAIVLIDQIGIEEKEGAKRMSAILNAGTNRLIPVCMAAATTVLGMLPLFSDVFFQALAVVIVFGLLVATVLTLVFVPVLYAAVYRIGNDEL